MKRLLMFFTIVITLTLVACSDLEESSSNEGTDEVETEGEDEQTINKETEVEESDESNENTNEAVEEENQEKSIEINEEAINHAYDIINGYDMVEDSHIDISNEDQKIILAIVVSAATNEDHAKDLGDNFARALASGVSIYSGSGLETPKNEYLGELYEYFDLHVGVGTGPDDFIVQGAKVTSADGITW